MGFHKTRTLNIFSAWDSELYAYEDTLYFVGATVWGQDAVDVEGVPVARIMGTVGRAIPFTFDLPEYAPSREIACMAILQHLDRLLGRRIACPLYSPEFMAARKVLAEPWSEKRELLADWLATIPESQDGGPYQSTMELLESVGFKPSEQLPGEYELTLRDGKEVCYARPTLSRMILLRSTQKDRRRDKYLPWRIESLEKLREKARAVLELPWPSSWYSEIEKRLEALPIWREHVGQDPEYDALCEVSRADLKHLLKDLRGYLDDPEPGSKALLSFDGLELSVRVKGKRYLLPASGAAWSVRYRTPAIAFCWTQELGTGLPDPCQVAVVGDRLVVGPWATVGVSVYNPDSTGEG